jgi:formate-dependent nitrite reductase membrane component NrfD|tara:strand:+ start:2238 stop:2378 length:141 start_codon:yes stop_codon:yes gene_type:complete
MLEAIVMTIGTIVFGVIMVFVALFSVVSILVIYDRYLAGKLGKRRK